MIDDQRLAFRGESRRQRRARIKSPVRRSAWAMALVLTVFIVWAFGQVARDAAHWTSYLFYVPSLVPAVVLLVLAVWCAIRSRRHAARLAALCALGPLLVVGLVENRWSSPSIASAGRPPLRLVHWNVARGAYGWRDVWQELEARPADLYVLSETPQTVALDWLAPMLGGERGEVHVGELAVAARGDLTLRECVNRDGAIACLIDWDSPRGPCTLLAADIPSAIHVDRRPHLAWLIELIARYTPDLVIGDLNAPRRSWDLTYLPHGYVHAYDQAGAGWSYTWPVPVPLLAIDHCLVGPRVQCADYRLESTSASDHRIQRLEFSIAGE